MQFPYSKRPKSGNRAGTKGYMNNPIQHEKLPGGAADKIDNPMFHSQQEGGGSYQTATVKSELDIEAREGKVKHLKSIGCQF